MKRRIFLAALAASTVRSQSSAPKLETLGTGFLGAEGPVWIKDGGYLLFSDTRAEKIHKYVPGQGITVWRENSGGANGNAVDREGRLYSCEYKTRRVSRTSKNGFVETLIDRYQGKRLNAPNDIVVRRDGHLWFTDPLFTKLEDRDLDYYGVYHRAPDGHLELIAKPQGRPNGITLSPGGRVLYVANTDERNIRAYDIDKKGKASNERVFIEKLASNPDGIKTDSAGSLYITGDDIAIYSKEGKLQSRIPSPEYVRNIAFGDRDFRTLYITSQQSLMKVALNVRGS